MADITKHDTKEEGEGYDCKNWRVYFFVVRHTICVYDLLEHVSDIILSEKCGRFYIVLVDLYKGWCLYVVVLALDLVDAHKHLFVVNRGDPAETCVELLFLLELIQVRI